MVFYIHVQDDAKPEKMRQMSTWSKRKLFALSFQHILPKTYVLFAFTSAASHGTAALFYFYILLLSTMVILFNPASTSFWFSDSTVHVNDVGRSIGLTHIVVLFYVMYIFQDQSQAMNVYCYELRKFFNKLDDDRKFFSYFLISARS